MMQLLYIQQKRNEFQDRIFKNIEADFKVEGLFWTIVN
jgi:hypothetical protein